MAMFFGKYNSKVDDKGRIVLPARLKNSLPEGSDTRFVIKKDLFQPCLQMFPYSVWENRSDKVLGSLDLTFNKNDAIFWREYMRDCEVVEPDAKLGRILVSRELLGAIGVNKEVVFSGNGFFIEIWATENYESSRLPEEEIIAIAECHSDK